MKKLSVSLLVAVLIFAANSASDAQVARQVFEGIGDLYAATAVYVITVPTAQHATGFFIKIPDGSDSVLFVTNQHVLERADSLHLTWLIMDTLKHVVRTVKVTSGLHDSLGNRIYVTPDDTTLDLAALCIPKPRSTGIPEAKYFSNIPSSWAAKYSALHAGFPVLFYGYPLGNRVGDMMPFALHGIIAGVDSLSHIIYLSGQAFPGASGSPVFLNPSEVNSINEEKFSPFVGAIAGYIPYRKPLVNPQTGQVEMVTTENSGIAAVMPAQEVLKLAEKARAKRAASKEK